MLSGCAISIHGRDVDFAGPHAKITHCTYDTTRQFCACDTLEGGGLSSWGEGAIAAVATLFTAHPLW